jgi:hypothetical protein
MPLVAPVTSAILLSSLRAMMLLLSFGGMSAFGCCVLRCEKNIDGPHISK